MLTGKQQGQRTGGNIQGRLTDGDQTGLRSQAVCNKTTASFQNKTGSTNGGVRSSVGEAARQPEGCVTRAMNVFDNSLALLDIAVLCTPHGSVQSFSVHGSVQTVHASANASLYRTSLDWGGLLGKQGLSNVTTASLQWTASRPGGVLPPGASAAAQLLPVCPP